MFVLESVNGYTTAVCDDKVVSRSFNGALASVQLEVKAEKSLASENPTSCGR